MHCCTHTLTLQIIQAIRVLRVHLIEIEKVSIKIDLIDIAVPHSNRSMGFYEHVCMVCFQNE